MELDLSPAPFFTVVSKGERYDSVLITFFDQELLEGRDKQNHQQYGG